MSVSERPLGIALVGCGAVARLQRTRVYPHVAHLGRVVATCDLVPERAQELAALLAPPATEPGRQPEPIAVYADLEAALADPRVDAIDVCTPHRHHAPVALQAIRAGKHVLVEKPLATTLEDGRRMVAAAREAGAVLAVNEQIRFLAPLLKARDMIAQGTIGRLACVRVHRIGYLSGAYMASGWRADPALAGGGMLLDQGPHYFHALRLLAGPVAGEITHVAALATTVRDDWLPGAEDTATVIVRYASGLIGEALYCWATRTPALGAWVYAYGTEGSLEAVSREAGLVWHRPGHPGGEVVLPAQRGSEDQVACLADFLQAVRRGGGASMPGEEGLRDLAVVDAAYRSIESGRLEPVEPI